MLQLYLSPFLSILRPRCLVWIGEDRGQLLYIPANVLFIMVIWEFNTSTHKKLCVLMYARQPFQLQLRCGINNEEKSCPAGQQQQQPTTTAVVSISPSLQTHDRLIIVP